MQFDMPSKGSRQTFLLCSSIPLPSPLQTVSLFLILISDFAFAIAKFYCALCL